MVLTSDTLLRAKDERGFNTLGILEIPEQALEELLVNALILPYRGLGTGIPDRLLSIMQGEMRRADIQTALGLKDTKHFRAYYLQPALGSGLIEMTVPDRPQSRLQRYRLAHPDSSES